MRLAEFIEANAQRIADGAEVFAATQAPSGVQLDSVTLRDHIPEVLAAIAKDLRTAQDPAEQIAKSEGRAARIDGPESAASTHGRLRAKSGFHIDQMVAEYRALRAAVLRLWLADHPPSGHDPVDLIRFNEAIDQALAESVADYSKETESWRSVFLGVLGHDLRGPLSVIVSTSELISKLSQGTPITEHTEAIMRSGRRMSRLLDDLLDHSRIALGMGIRIVPTEIDLHAALSEEITLLRAALPAATIRFSATGAETGRFDASRICEAVNNLVTNAAKYGDSEAEIQVTLDGDDDQVEIVVCNRGAELPPGLLNSMFEPLQRGTERAASGERQSLGLGLFIVREIVASHGGEVTVSSVAGETAFKLRIPRVSRKRN